MFHFGPFLVNKLLLSFQNGPTDMRSVEIVILGIHSTQHICFEGISNSTPVKIVFANQLQGCQRLVV